MGSIPKLKKFRFATPKTHPYSREYGEGYDNINWNDNTEETIESEQGEETSKNTD